MLIGYEIYWEIIYIHTDFSLENLKICKNKS